MAKVVATDRHFILSNGNTIIAHEINNPYNVHILRTNEDDQYYSAPVCSASEESLVKTKQQLSTECLDVLCMVACKCGSHLAAATNEKQLVVWTMKDSFVPTCVRKLPRKCLSMAFLKDCSHILIADKTGDVIRYDVKDSNPKNNGVLILGHLSMILDIALAFNDEYVLTCDRDEKIRVSCYPNCYNIHSFCLGHSEFVIKLDFLRTNQDILISGSGDGTLKFWRFKDGQEIGNIQCRDHLPDHCLKVLHTDQDKCINQQSSSLVVVREENTEEKLSVKKFVCSRNNSIAVSYHRLPVIGIYQAEVLSVDYRVRCVHKTNHLLDFEPLDMIFDANDILWVFSLSTKQPIQVFGLQSTTENGLSAESPKVQNLLKRLNANSAFFKDLNDNPPSIIPSLYKQWYDNVTPYLSVKRARQQQKECKKIKRQGMLDAEK